MIAEELCETCKHLRRYHFFETHGSTACKWHVGMQGECHCKEFVDALATGGLLVQEDRLTAMLERQRAISDKIDGIARMQADPTAWTDRFSMAAAEECFELRRCVQHRWWHQGPKPPIDRNKVKKELTDIVCFVLNLALLWGMDAEEIDDAHEKVCLDNEERFLAVRPEVTHADHS